MQRLLTPVYLSEDIDYPERVWLSASDGFANLVDFFDFLNRGGKARVTFNNSVSEIINWDWDAHLVVYYDSTGIISIKDVYME